MIRRRKNFLVALIIALSFFVFSLFTLSDYGISWDEPIHFHRGQAYLHYFLTGEETFASVSGQRSYYQNENLNGAYFLQNDSGHPPLNGILAALTNYIFYQQTGLMGDINSHHLFNILISSLLIFIVVLFASESAGIFAGIIAGLSISLYPLFFAESRFNIKDPSEAAFFALTIYSFWRAAKTWSWKWVILAAVFFGMGFGTKFNILFLPVIVLPWVIYKIVYLDKLKTNFTIPFSLAVLISPLIILAIFFGSWPYLWQDTLVRVLEIFGYYKQIGSGFNYQTSTYYLPFGLNIYAIVWILYTTPPYILFLSIIGALSAIFSFRRKDGAPLLWLLWFVIPIARVTLPGTSIYGGVRQIMEYIPAMALLAGFGAQFLLNYLKKVLPKINTKLVIALLLVGFLQIAQVLANIHPNENVYFNSFIGGLSGAKAAEIPSWGNSFGNAYYQALKWFNQNAASGSNVGLIQGTGLNIPRIMLRQDLIFNNLSWSGIQRSGEYMLELTHQSSSRAYPYAWDYVDRVLNPVYEVKVDGVAIAKLWKNDISHSKPEYQKPESEISFTKSYNPLEKSLTLTLSKEVLLTRVVINYSFDNCIKPEGRVWLSVDSKEFTEEPDGYPYQFVTELEKKPDTIYQYFAIPQARYVKFIDKSEKSCLFGQTNVVVKGFE